nr:hypothetical protein Iba_chr01dCG8890 [Ipomoea batatas]
MHLHCEDLLPHSSSSSTLESQQREILPLHFPVSFYQDPSICQHLQYPIQIQLKVDAPSTRNWRGIGEPSRLERLLRTFVLVAASTCANCIPPTERRKDSVSSDKELLHSSGTSVLPSLCVSLSSSIAALLSSVSVSIGTGIEQLGASIEEVTDSGFNPMLVMFVKISITISTPEPRRDDVWRINSSNPLDRELGISPASKHWGMQVIASPEQMTPSIIASMKAVGRPAASKTGKQVGSL